MFWLGSGALVESPCLAEPLQTLACLRAPALHQCFGLTLNGSQSGMVVLKPQGKMPGTVWRAVHLPIA